MNNIIPEILMCLAAAACLMMFHEGVKVIVYVFCKGRECHFSSPPWKLWRYIDPVGMILALVSYVPVSKPYFFRIRDQKTNCCLGIAGLCSLAFATAVGILLMKKCYGGLDGISHMVLYHWWEKLLPMFVQYIPLLSFGMLCANLFPVSTFDMGLLIAGISPRLYLGMLRSDGIVKMIFVLVLMLDIIHYAAARLLVLFL